MSRKQPWTREYVLSSLEERRAAILQNMLEIREVLDGLRDATSDTRLAGMTREQLEAGIIYYASKLKDLEDFILTVQRIRM